MMRIYNYILFAVLILHLLTYNTYSQVEIQYKLYLKTDVFDSAVVYTEHSLWSDTEIFTNTKLTSFDDYYIKTKEIDERNSVTNIFPKYLYSLYYNVHTNTLETRELVLLASKSSNDRYLIIDTIEYPNWNITNKTKIINGYTCIKAETNFRCKTYTVWFTTEIPIPAGPWKLQGLPGLIVEAYDQDKERFYKLSRYDPTPSNYYSNKSIDLGKANKTITRKQLREYYNKIEERLNAATQVDDLNINCADCPKTESKYKINLWECY